MSSPHTSVSEAASGELCERKINENDTRNRPLIYTVGILNSYRRGQSFDFEQVAI
jgi:hypothetical protein